MCVPTDKTEKIHERTEHSREYIEYVYSWRNRQQRRWWRRQRKKNHNRIALRSTRPLFVLYLCVCVVTLFCWNKIKINRNRYRHTTHAKIQELTVVSTFFFVVFFSLNLVYCMRVPVRVWIILITVGLLKKYNCQQSMWVIRAPHAPMRWERLNYDSRSRAKWSFAFFGHLLLRMRNEFAFLLIKYWAKNWSYGHLRAIWISFYIILTKFIAFIVQVLPACVRDWAAKAISARATREFLLNWMDLYEPKSGSKPTQ